MTEMVSRLNDIEEIKQLKYTYMRTVDLNRWDDLAECLADDVVCWYDSGRHKHEGKAAVLDFLQNTSLAKPDSSSLHLVSHPVITIESDDRAVATWALSDTVVDRSKKTVLRGAAYYRDEYVRTDEGWRILSTGYDRLYELRDALD
ncbi:MULTISPECIES: nuclear transport factor 2 family protein [unclassified Rhodococcus (in: high G+C Gram-positive bacteria)]|uniref:nuclear transport factor 2 family protein n=1 Tax=Rhodococcus sp. SJ-3 TaxID=3454628 RepID=UPI003F7AE92C